MMSVVCEFNVMPSRCYCGGDLVMGVVVAVVAVQCQIRKVGCRYG